MRRDFRELIADWLILLGALALLVSLFLPWSHQRLVPDPMVGGIPRDPTAWQVYSMVDVALALLAALLVAVAALGGRARRLVALGGGAVALAFTVHALGTPPTTGTVLAGVAVHARAGAGAVVAVIALGVAVVGVALSYTAD